MLLVTNALARIASGPSGTVAVSAPLRRGNPHHIKNFTVSATVAIIASDLTETTAFIAQLGITAGGWFGGLCAVLFRNLEGF